MRILIAATMALLGAAGAFALESDSQPKPSKVPEAVADGAPVSCIPLNRIRSTRVYDDKTIDFVLNGKQVYRNVLPHDCPSLGFEERFSYKTSLTQLCSTDIITVLYQTPRLSPGASCGLGQFQPVKLVKK